MAPAPAGVCSSACGRARRCLRHFADRRQRPSGGPSWPHEEDPDDVCQQLGILQELGQHFFFGFVRLLQAAQCVKQSIWAPTRTALALRRPSCGLASVRLTSVGRDARAYRRLARSVERRAADAERAVGFFAGRQVPGSAQGGRHLEWCHAAHCHGWGEEP